MTDNVFPMPDGLAFLATTRERALRAEVHALRGAVARLEEALAERTARVTDIELALLQAFDIIMDCREALKQLGVPEQP